jgi:hypothetical protein
MYDLSFFKSKGLYIEKPDAAECSLEGGRVIAKPRVSDKIIQMMRKPGGDSHGGDFSRQDSAVITAFLNAGYSPADAFATFLASPRGRHAAERKEGHLEDYVERTIRKSLGLVEKGGGPEKIKIDFAKDPGKKAEGSGLITRKASDYEIERIHWLWPGYIPSAKLTILAGDPGLGKSTITLDLAARISRGSMMPNDVRGLTGMTLMASAEDTPADTIVPRLIAAGANRDKIEIIEEVKDPDEINPDETRFLCFPRDNEFLRQKLISSGARLLIIDPLNAFIEKNTDTYKDQDIRLVLHPLNKIAEETGTAILIVAHLTKNEESSALYRVGGSIGFIGAARSVLAVSKTKEGSRVLYSLKNNLAAHPTALGYETKQVQKRNNNGSGHWKGEMVVKSNGIRWLGEVDFDPFQKQATVADNDSLEAAIKFLNDELKEQGEVDTDSLFKEARSAGVPRPVLNRARTHLKITVKKVNGTWRWKWPDNTN